MAITEKQLRDALHRAGFPLERRPQAFELIWRGLELFREYRTRKYYSCRTSTKVHKTLEDMIPAIKPIKRPKPEHHAPAGRYDQTCARTILISALCRGWQYGFDKSPTLNNKHDPDSDFAIFASEVMGYEGIGKIHTHLEEYWSIRKNSQPK